VAVLLVTEKGRSCPDVAASLGIPLGTLYKWVEEYKKRTASLEAILL
jgi:transposase